MALDYPGWSLEYIWYHITPRAAKFLLAQARRRQAREYAELVTIHHPKDPAKLAESYRQVAMQSPGPSGPSKPIDPEEQDARNTAGLIKLAQALGDTGAVKRIRERTMAAKVLRRVKARKKETNG